MHRVRMAVRENRLTSTLIVEADYVPAIETSGRGWVIEREGEIVAFAVGNAVTGNIWALFVHPDHERRGYGRRLHDAMVDWLWTRRLDTLWLTTQPATRAQSFYAAAGWREAGRADGEVRYEMTRREVKQAIGFRRLGVDDLQQMFLWLIRPHVTKWYAPSPTSFAETVAKYGPRTQEGNAVEAFIVTLDGADVGYIQTYAIDIFPEYGERLGCEKGAAGVDLFIGEEQLLNRGLGAQVLRRFVEEVVFGANGAPACLAGPDEGNVASIRAFEKAGFTRWKTVRMDDERIECVLRIERGAAP